MPQVTSTHIMGQGINGIKILKKRHNLTNRKPDNVDGGRLRMANTTVWKQYFDLLEATIDKLGLRHEPNAILQWINAMN